MRQVSPEEMRQMLQSASQNDGRSKHIWDSGYTHSRCGGPAETAAPPNLLAYCKRCQVAIPTRELVRA